MIRFVIFVLFILGIDFLAFQILQVAASPLPEMLDWGWKVAYWIIPLAYIIWLTFGREKTTKNNSEGKYRMIRSIFYLIYFAKFILIALSLIGELGSLLLLVIANFLPILSPPILSSIFFAQLISMIALVPMLLMIYGILRNRHRYQLFQVDVPIANLPEALEGLKIVQISDIHSGSFTDKEPLKKAIDLINKQAADLVFFTGDLVNSIAAEIIPYIDVFDKIKAKYGVFSVLGNHDYGDYVGWPSAEAKERNLVQLKNIQKQMGWDLLMNEHRLLTIANEKIAIIGVENFSASPRFSKYGNLSKAYQGSQTAALKLLLSHDPSHWDFEITKKFKDIALTFSGHTHGAQFGIEIENIIKWSPVKYFYKQWAGLYHKAGQYLYVNRGFGYLAYPGRVGILPEVTLIKLTRKY